MAFILNILIYFEIFKFQSFNIYKKLKKGKTRSGSKSTLRYNQKRKNGGCSSAEKQKFRREMREEKAKLGRMLREAERFSDDLKNLCGSGRSVFRETTRAFNRLSEHLKKVYLGKKILKTLI